jgi:hypothetical protein
MNQKLDQIVFEFNFFQTLLIFLVGLTGLLAITLFFLLQGRDLLVQEVRLAGHTLDLVFLVDELPFQHAEQILVFATVLFDVLLPLEHIFFGEPKVVDEGLVFLGFFFLILNIFFNMS